MESTENKKEYLKKYLSGGDKKRRKKKIITSSSSVVRSKIIDDDFDLKKLRLLGENELDILDMNEDAPQVVGIVDDRPDDIRLMSQFRETKKWKVITRDYEDVKVSAIKDPDSDPSPPRTQSKENPKKVSQKKRVTNSDSDVDVPRKKGSESDVSVPRKKKYDSDVSPPRRSSKMIKEAPERSKPQRKTRNSDDSDISPPRKKKPADSDSDLSPKRNSKHRQSGRDRSPPRGHSRDDRRRRDSDKSYRERHSEKSNKTLEGKKAGLQNVDDMRKEAAAIRKKQIESMEKLGDDVSGRGAATIVRDRRTGRKKDYKEEARLKREKEEKEAELQEKYAVWGKGVKQVDERAAKMRDEYHEMSKPLARYANDADLEELQKNQEREGDPMLDYFREKKKKEGRSGPVKQLYQGNFMPNRYGIRPGSKWDGVDRSNGYEKKWFEEQNKRRAIQDDSYKWSTEDM